MHMLPAVSSVVLQSTRTVKVIVCLESKRFLAMSVLKFLHLKSIACLLITYPFKLLNLLVQSVAWVHFPSIRFVCPERSIWNLELY
jgi:hypothetical protein